MDKVMYMRRKWTYSSTKTSEHKIKCMIYSICVAQNSFITRFEPREIQYELFASD